MLPSVNLQEATEVTVGRCSCGYCYLHRYQPAQQSAQQMARREGRDGENSIIFSLTLCPLKCFVLQSYYYIFFFCFKSLTNVQVCDHQMKFLKIKYFWIFMMSWSLKLNGCVCSALPVVYLYRVIPQGTVFALLLALFLCGVHWVQCSAVQRSSHVGSVGSVSSVSLEAVWLDQVAVPDLWYQSPVVAATTVGRVSPLSSCPLLTLHVLYSFSAALRLAA